MKHLVLLILMVASSSFGASWYVSTNGSGTGSIGSPGSLTNALTHVGWGTNVAAGDTVWLRGGTYSNAQWTVSFSGSSGNHVTWRNYTNETVVIDRRWSFGNNQFHRFWGIEFTDTKKGTYGTSYPYLHFDDNSPSDGNSWINCTFHDVQNLFAGNTAYGGVRGCIGWNIGENVLEHTIYGGLREVSGNIFAWSSGYHLNAYADTNALIRSNIMFGWGVTVTQDTAAMIMGTVGAGPRISFNRTYAYSNDNSAAIKFGYGGDTGEQGNAWSNTFVARIPYSVRGTFSSLVTTGNVIYSHSSDGAAVEIGTVSSATWDRNAYYANNHAVQFDDGIVRTFTQWKTNHQTWDINSTSSDSTKPPDAVYVIPNADEAKRAHVAVYNWTKANNVSVDLSSVLSNGDTYSLYSAQNFGAGPIQTGTFGGSTISVPMTNLATASKLYGKQAQGNVTSPEFGAFVIIGQAGSAITPQVKHQSLDPLFL